MKENTVTTPENSTTHKTSVIQNKGGEFWEKIKNLLDECKNNAKNSKPEKVWSLICEQAQRLTGSLSNLTKQEQDLQKLIQGIIIDNNTAENLSTNINNKYVKDYLIGAGLLVAGAAAIATPLACMPTMIATLGTDCAMFTGGASILCGAGPCCMGERNRITDSIAIKQRNIDFKDKINSLQQRLEEIEDSYEFSKAKEFLDNCSSLFINLAYLSKHVKLSPSNALELLDYYVKSNELYTAACEKFTKLEKNKKLNQQSENYNNKIANSNNNTSNTHLDMFYKVNNQYNVL